MTMSASSLALASDSAKRSMLALHCTAPRRPLTHDLKRNLFGNRRICCRQQFAVGAWCSVSCPTSACRWHRSPRASHNLPADWQAWGCAMCQCPGRDPPSFALPPTKSPTTVPRRWRTVPDCPVANLYGIFLTGLESRLKSLAALPPRILRLAVSSRNGRS